MSIPSRLQLWNACLGNLFEHYDTALFGFLSPFLAPLIFPHTDPLTALILTYAIIPLGMLARPIGALVFGYIGDKYGRNQALFLTLSGMALVSGAMALSPTYAQLGLLAPLLFCIGRALQNFLSAGETMGGAIFLLENTQEKHHDLFSGFYSASTIGGHLLASLGVFILSRYQVIDPGWRVLYLLGCITALFGCMVRRRTQLRELQNSSAWQNRPFEPFCDPSSSPTRQGLGSSEGSGQPGLSLQTDSKSSIFPGAGVLQLPQLFEPSVTLSFSFGPLKEMLWRYKKAFLLIMITAGFASASYSIALVLMNGFIPLVSSLTKTEVMQINTYLLGFDLCALPFFGWVASKISRKALMLSASLGATLFAMPLFMLLQDATLLGVIGIRICLVLFGVAFFAPFHAWAQQMIPPAHRYAVISLGYALGSQLLGSPTAAISLWCFQKTGQVWSVSVYWIALGLISSLILIFDRRKEHEHRFQHAE